MKAEVREGVRERFTLFYPLRRGRGIDLHLLAKIGLSRMKSMA